MANLNLSSIELVSSIRKAPLNGPPSSSDFNRFQQEILADLSSLAGYVDEVLNPMLNSLRDTAALGLDGASIYADATSESLMFHDGSGVPFTVSEVCATLSGAQTALAQQLADVQARIRTLTQRLATTQQNDMRASIQSMQDTVSSLVSRLNSALADIGSQGAQLSGQRRAIVALPENIAGNYNIDVDFTPLFGDNNYVVSLAIEGANSHGITVSYFVKKESGVGLTVTVAYDGTAPSGNLHVMAQAI